MRKRLLVINTIVYAFVGINSFAQQKEKTEKLDEVVITATKFPLKKENTGNVIHKITQKELQQNAGKSVIEVLNTLVGVDIRGVATNAAEPKSITIRGGRSRQVLVLIDGVPVTDQSAINQEFDLRLLAINQIESIEVLKGSSSTLYGSGAATAVINIILKKATKNAISGAFTTSIGTNNTATSSKNNLADRRQNINVNGSLDAFHFVASFSLVGIDGMSSAKSKNRISFEEDAFYSRNALLKLGYQIHKKTTIEAFFNLDAFDYDFDAGAFSDNSLNTGNQKQLRFGLKPKFNYKNGELYLLASVNTVKREINEFNSYSNTLGIYQYKGKSIYLDAVNKTNFKNSKIQLITGINYQNHSNNTITPFGEIDKSIANFNTLDPYASLVYISDYGLSASGGGRLNIHNIYGNHFVYNANLAYTISKNTNTPIKLLTSYSTAFIAPSLFQLYDGFSGNINLKPESNKTFELGFDINFRDWAQLDAVYFNRNEQDAILYNNTTYKYANGASKASGIELNSKVMPTDFLTLNIGYTYINKDRFEDFNDYIPANKLVFGIDATVAKKMYINATYRGVGERTYFDRYGNFATAGTEITLPSYKILNIATNYRLLDETVTFFGAITNLTNEEYDDTLGYTTQGRNYKIGIRIQF